MVAFRDDFSRLFDEYSNDAVLIRNDRKKTCKCVDALTLSPNDKCQVCLGTGYINQAEKVRIRSKATSSSDTLPKIVNFATVGNIGVALREFFMEYTVRPLRSDLIIFCEWDGLKPVFDEYTEIYEVNNAEPMRGERGQIEFFKVLAKSDPINMTVRFNNLQKNADKMTYYIATKG